MTGKGSITHAPNRRMKMMLILQLIWLALVFGLGAWWASFSLRQAERITELENRLGIAAAGDSQWVRTSRMIFWESSTFFALLIATTIVLWWVYLRDLKRARSLQAFFASVTHELRTPLTSIRLQAETIAEGNPDPSLVRRLMEDTLRLESQVERTLELARVEGGGKLFSQSIRLKPWLERMLKSWREAHASVDVQLNIKDVTIQADVTGLQVILKNLLENSVRHSGRTDEAGKQKLEITISSELQNEKTCVVRFRDNGEGYTGNPVELGKLFHKGAHSQGAGVGLYLVRMLMERMGGKVLFENRDRAPFEIALVFQTGEHHGA
jgi:signal transduction histidine kinase